MNMHGTRNGLQLTCGLLIFNVSAMFEGEEKNLTGLFPGKMLLCE